MDKEKPLRIQRLYIGTFWWSWSPDSSGEPSTFPIPSGRPPICEGDQVVPPCIADSSKILFVFPAGWRRFGSAYVRRRPDSMDGVREWICSHQSCVDSPEFQHSRLSQRSIDRCGDFPEHIRKTPSYGNTMAADLLAACQEGRWCSWSPDLSGEPSTFPTQSGRAHQG